MWKDIKGFEGLYQISDKGEVKSLIRNKILKLTQDKDGYLTVGLKGKKFKVHRLVAEAFIDNPNNYPCVNHKDENKKNNSVDNLEWCSIKYNINYGNKIKNTAQKISRRVICLETNIIFNSCREAEEKMNLNKNTVSRVCRENSKYNSVKGYHFNYI